MQLKFRRSSKRAILLSTAAATLTAGAFFAKPADTAVPTFVEPKVFSSSKGVLDIVMVAKAKPVFGQTVGWVYEICPRASATQKDCTGVASTVSDYGGVRLALTRGDALKIRFVNQLPPITDSDHAQDPMHESLALNPTNLHTHGLVVQARAPTAKDPTYGDNIYVSVFNTANGATPTPSSTSPDGFPLDMHGSIIAENVIDYRIDIPKNHPLGQFFFHPHVHGISLNQMSMGMAGIISIGKESEYARGDDAYQTPFADQNVRHLILKDMQILPTGVALSQEDPNFCGVVDQAQASNGYCAGVDSFAGGKWNFTVSGQTMPHIPIKSPNGEVWRLTNASGNVTYDLQLLDPAKTPVAVQLLSVDGVTINLPATTAPGTVVQLTNARFKVAACPGASTTASTLPTCVTEFVMFPGTRVEVWVAYRDAKGNVTTTPSSGIYTLQQTGVHMGVDPNQGDTWPAVNLATMQFTQTTATRYAKTHLNVVGEALTAFQPTAIFKAPVPYAVAAPLPANCAALAPGHRRRIFFGNDANGNFGLGYEETDANGVPVPGTQQDISQYNPDGPFVCLPLAAQQKPATETWELVNLAQENHNFHIHQTKFRQVDPSAPSTSPLSPTFNGSIGAGVLEDSHPLPVSTPLEPVQNGSCTIDQWRNNKCTTSSVFVNIPFSQLGEFVYHCHILEHEDGGMMAKIKVVAAPR